MSLNDRIKQAVKSYEDEAIELRRYLHTYPELSSQEFETSKYLKKYLEEYGFEIQEVAPDHKSSGTGFLAVYDTGRPGKTVGLRADLDGLPVQETESNMKQERVCRSKNDGVMHACGHDVHMTVLTIAGKILKDMADQLSGKFVLIFEEAEENGNGIEAMLNHMKESDLDFDVIYGNHVLQDAPAGTIACDDGPVMAAAALVDFKVVGKGGHGSRPDLSINPVFAGAAIINSLGAAWANQVDVTETVTLGIAKFNAGEAANVFVDEAEIAGTLRYYNDAEGRKAYDTVMKVAENVAAAHNCTIVANEYAGPQTYPVINDPEVAQVVRDSIEELYPGRLQPGVVSFASESFARYEEICPIAFSFIGVYDEEFGSTSGIHNEYFDVPEYVMEYGIGTMVKFATHYLADN